MTIATPAARSTAAAIRLTLDEQGVIYDESHDGAYVTVFGTAYSLEACIDGVRCYRLRRNPSHDPVLIFTAPDAGSAVDWLADL